MSANPHSVRKISDDTLVKASWNFGDQHLEASTIEFVRTHTTIPIPRVRRRFEDEEALSIIVMDYIPGERLDLIWPSLSLWSKLWVALTLRRYIRQLRQINSSVPGPLGDSPRWCGGLIFGIGVGSGPFPDYASLSAFYNRKLDIAKKITYPDRHGNQIPSAGPDTEPFDDSRPLVFAHQDLTMRNVILGRDGRVWLVDWGLSGFYPPWFEYVSMVYAAERDGAPESWNRLIPLIGDPLFEHMRWMDRIVEALSLYR
jgi:aminoglycoside phosphotransferase (APT) family kinase protein